MVKYPRTHLGVVLTLAVLFAATSLVASAQVRGSSGQAALHIRINLVPTLTAPAPPVEPKKPLVGPVSYDVPAMKSNVETIEEIRPLFIGNAGQAQRLDGAVLKTLTIVLR